MELLRGRLDRHTYVLNFILWGTVNETTYRSGVSWLVDDLRALQAFARINTHKFMSYVKKYVNKILHNF